MYVKCASYTKLLGRQRSANVRNNYLSCRAEGLSSPKANSIGFADDDNELTKL